MLATEFAKFGIHPFRILAAQIDRSTISQVPESLRQARTYARK